MSTKSIPKTDEELAYMMRVYTLRDKIPVRCTSLLEAAEEQAKGLDPEHGQPWRIGYDQVDGNVISTVFLGRDMRHSFSEGPPILFETMVFNNQGDDIGIDRCCSYDEAIAMHEAMIQRVKEAGRAGHD